MFLSNKYAYWYFSLIEKRKTFTPEGKTEKHHVIPWSLGGTDELSNLVRLTLREHFICHLLLAKMTEGMNRARMQLAVVSFRQRKGFIKTSRHYALVRSYHSSAMSQIMTEKMKSPEYRKRLSESAKNLPHEVRQRVSDSTRVKSDLTRGRMVQAALARDPTHNQKISLALTGKTMSDDVKKKVSEAVKNLPKLTCPHCKKVGSQSNMKRWHFDKCPTL